VRRQVEQVAARREGAPASALLDDGKDHWLVRSIAGKTMDLGVLAIDLGHKSNDPTVLERVDAVLTQATETMERLDLDNAISEARVRSEADALRDALIDSVSHQLRTPLVSILGAATLISQAPANSGDTRLASLSGILRDEVERLNGDVQDLLDAAVIASKGVRPEVEWVDPADIVNAAVERRERLLAAHEVVLDVAGELPLIYVDSVLIEQALGQIIDNAAKYSKPGSAIVISARASGTSLALSVRDQGIGLVGDEQTRLWERFYRGERYASHVKGSGLGLWIARAFVAANGGDIEAFSEGADRGTLITIHLPVSAPSPAIPDVGHE
jgi:two-component system sensor histidine kinase KdpD